MSTFAIIAHVLAWVFIVAAGAGAIITILCFAFVALAQPLLRGDLEPDPNHLGEDE